MSKLSIDGITRRGFLWTLGSRVAGAGLLTASLDACSSGGLGVQPALTGGLRGTVTDLQGAPQGIGRIYLLLDSGLNQNSFADVTAAGTFDFGSVPIGNYQLRYWGGSEASVPEPLENPVRIAVKTDVVSIVQFKIARGTPSASLHEIYAGDFFFQDQPFGQPNATVVVKLGVTVCWYNVGVMNHTVTGGPWGDSGTIERAEEFMWTANTLGSFGYRCNFHNPQMQSILQVVA